MSDETNDPTRGDVERAHYGALAPLLADARDVLADALEAEDDRLRFSAARYVLNNARRWIDRASYEDHDRTFGVNTGPSDDRVAVDVADAVEGDE